MAKEYAKDKCNDYKWSNDEYNALVQLWQKESGWSVTAGNPDNAYGIPQACPGKKMSSSGKDWKTNYKTQINWGLKYINGTYGTPSKALEHFNKEKWY